MNITREFLEEHIARMNQQIAAYQGAVEFAEMLLRLPDEPSLSFNPLEQIPDEAIKPLHQETNQAGP